MPASDVPAVVRHAPNTPVRRRRPISTEDSMDSARVSGGFNRDALAEIPPALERSLERGVLSGLVTVIWRRGEIVQLNTLGRRDVAAKAPMEHDTLFRIASMTKPVT